MLLKSRLGTLCRLKWNQLDWHAVCQGENNGNTQPVDIEQLHVSVTLVQHVSRRESLTPLKTDKNGTVGAEQARSTKRSC